MGKKVKIGKQRRDKAYWSAKEIGFRSRASFKLLQLNRKFEFLQKSRVCVDLCAAPGSWMQVAKQNMPLSSLIVGVDLVPIKPIPGCISMVNDITADKCRTDLKRELQGWKADLVLHDGAPNVGKSWIHDAYQQSLLSLSAFKLATEFLKPGGHFVSKVFRSKDYQSLLWVFNQFFRKVHATKPAASRNESAEIFVVCAGYKAPDKIDPRFLDPVSVFSEVEASEKKDNSELICPEKTKKAPADGYDGASASLLYRKTTASEFIKGNQPIHVLNNCHEIVLDSEDIKGHPKTTPEIVACLKDVKVLGIKELRAIKKWREVLRAEMDEKKKEASKDDASAEPGNEGDSDDEELRKLEAEIDTLNDEERRAAKRKRKRLLSEKRKRAEKIDLKMLIPGDVGPVMQEQGLFSIKDFKSAAELEAVQDDMQPEVVAEDSDDDREPMTKKVKYVKGVSTLDKSGLFYKDSSSDEEQGDSEDEDDVDGSLRLGDEDPSGPVMKDEDADKLNDPSSNPLLLDLDESNREARRKKKSELWFDKDVFKGIDDDEELEELDIANAIKSIENKGGSIMKKKKEVKSKTTKKVTIKEEESSESESDDDNDGDESDSDSDSDYEFTGSKGHSKGPSGAEQEGFEVVPVQKVKKRAPLTPEELALGQKMIRSKKTKRDIIDDGWNRYAFADRDEDLPDWFVHEEQYHMRKRPEVDPETVAYYQDKRKDLNVKTIKKVVEAKARKKRSISKRMDKAKKRAAAILNNDDVGSREKAKEINRIYKKIASKEKAKQEVTYSVAKKFAAAKRAKRPAGVKGLYKQVDPRMKKDNTQKRTNASTKRLQKRRLKGKKTRPNAK